MRFPTDTVRFCSACLLALAACGGPTQTRPTLEPPSGTVDTPAEVVFAVPDRESSDRDFSIRIARSFASPEEAALILAAEMLDPPRAETLAWVTEGGALAPDDIPEAGPVWWYADFDCVRIAYAITDDALTYYSDLVEAFSNGNFEGSCGLEMGEAELEYEATVESQARFEHEGRVFENVHVVRMDLSWFQWCGNLCAMGFSRERIVVFGADGEPAAVLGDGPTEIVVS